MLTQKRTKIVCTIGPASESVEMLIQLVKSGMNVARLNFSHNTYESHAQVIKNIRIVSAKLKVPIAILQDLQGPKIRISKLEEPVEIKNGQKVVIGKDFTMDFDVSKDVKKGHRVLIQDGLLELVVDKVVKGNIYCTVRNGGLVRSHKGMNFPDTRLSSRVMTSKDVADAKFGLEQDVDYIALSFVRNAKDVLDLRKLILKFNPKGYVEPKIISKIELPEAIEKFDEILTASDGVMVARGDLGVEVPPGEVPVMQKDMVKKCLEHAKPVIVATQMLESMVDNPRPTRAEVSDVANAVVDRTDATMLSGESAYGKYPVQAVTIMSQTIKATERSPYSGPRCIFMGEKSHGKTAAIAAAACELSKGVDAPIIMSATDSGATARLLAHQRPEARIIMLTDKAKIYRQMALNWGIEPLLVQRWHKLSELINHSIQEAKKAGLVKPGDRVLLVAGNPIGEKANVLEVKTV
jgi:pyruvate kinase